MENYFGIYVIFRRWNQCKRGPTVPTTHQGTPTGPRRALVSCALLERRLRPFFWRKKDNLWKKIVLEVQRNRSYGSPGI